jgi:hypothetical protein
MKESDIHILDEERKWEHMKATTVCVLVIAGTMMPALAQDQNQPLVKVRWQTEIKHPLDGETDSQNQFKELPPPILYEKAPTATNTLMRMRLDYSYTTSGEKRRESIATGKAIEFSILEPSGTISNASWYNASVLLMRLSGCRGTGTVYIAFFEPLGKESYEKAEVGHQLSNWLELPISLPDQTPALFGH